MTKLFWMKKQTCCDTEINYGKCDSGKLKDCSVKRIIERFFIRLCDTYLLRGSTNRRLKKVEVLESSFIDLIKHINTIFCNTAFVLMIVTWED